MDSKLPDVTIRHCPLITSFLSCRTSARRKGPLSTLLWICGPSATSEKKLMLRNFGLLGSRLTRGRAIEQPPMFRFWPCCVPGETSILVMEQVKSHLSNCSPIWCASIEGCVRRQISSFSGIGPKPFYSAQRICAVGGSRFRRGGTTERYPGECGQNYLPRSLFKVRRVSTTQTQNVGSCKTRGGYSQ